MSFKKIFVKIPPLLQGNYDPEVLSNRLNTLSEQIENITPIYNEYVARVLLTSSGVTIEDVINNTLSFSLNFAKTATGRYEITTTPANQFSSTKTYCRGDLVSDPGSTYSPVMAVVVYNTVNSIQIVIRDRSGDYTNVSVRMLIEVRQYS